LDGTTGWAPAIAAFAAGGGGAAAAGASATDGFCAGAAGLATACFGSACFGSACFGAAAVVRTIDDDARSRPLALRVAAGRWLSYRAAEADLARAESQPSDCAGSRCVGEAAATRVAGAEAGAATTGSSSGVSLVSAG
jgi:hypothetical protein